MTTINTRLSNAGGISSGYIFRSFRSQDDDSEFSVFVLLVSDFFIVNSSILLAQLCIFLSKSHWIELDFLFYFYAYFFWIFYSFLLGQYKQVLYRGARRLWKKTLGTLCLYEIMIYILLSQFHKIADNNIWLMFFFIHIFILSALLFISRLYITYLIEFVAGKARLKRTCVIFGHENTNQLLSDYFESQKHLYNIVHKENIKELIDCADKIVDFVKESSISFNELFLSFPYDRNFDELLTVAQSNCIKVYFLGQIGETSQNQGKIREFIPKSGLCVQSIRSEPLSSIKNRIWKRMFDLFFSTCVIIFILSWLFPIVGLIIKSTSRGPILFRQLRSGKDNVPFYCYKFRSMGVNKDSDSVQATKNDVRVTKIGAFLRKTSLDELPQFLNVWKGEMSIVGPRPHMLKHTEIYRELIGQYMVRQYLKPGITGWAQVNGYRGETKELFLMEKRVEHDIAYMENWSFLLDLKIVFMTVINVFRGESAAY